MKSSGRVLPHNIEAESSLLASVLLSADAAMSLSNLEEIDFYSSAHKEIFIAMRKLLRENSPIDLVTLSDKLETDDKLSMVGGAKYLSSLTNLLPSASNYMAYLDIIKRDSLLRQIIDASMKIIDNSFSSTNDKSALSFAEKMIFDIGKNEEKSSLTHLEPSLNEAMDYFDLIARDKDALQGVKTGFYSLDKLTSGLHKGDLVLLAARPSVGKSSFAMNIVVNMALAGRNVAVFSLEMPKRQLAERALCSVANVNMALAKKGEMKSEDWKKLFIAKNKLAKANIMVDDSSLVTPLDLLSKCRKLKREKGLDFIMVDYLQLMSSGGKNDNRQQEVSEMSRSLKIAAKELGVPILLLSQLSRAVETRAGHKPVLSDLRESGAIEQDADIVMFLHNASRYGEKVNEAEIQDVSLIVAKHRNGALGELPLKFITHNTTFVNVNKDSDAASLEASLSDNGKITKKEIENTNAPDMVALDDMNDLDDIF